MLYNTGLDALATIASADLRWLLLAGTGYTFDRDHAVVADLTPGTNELSVAGYTRETLTGGTRTVNDTLERIEYTADNPDFGSLTTGQTITACVLYLHVTNDADSPLVAYYEVTPLDAAVIDPYVVYFTAGLLAYLDEL